MSLVELLASAKASGDYSGLVDAIPYAKFMGISCTKHPDGAELVTTMTYAPQLIGNAQLPALHGGTLGALLESAAIFELMWRAETIVLPKTITFTVDFTRSAAAVDTYAHAVITRQGRRITNVRAEAWQDDRARPVAKATAIFLVMRD
ncbi:PaaI family thioesterase [soil metagenome]